MVTTTMTRLDPRPGRDVVLMDPTPTGRATDPEPVIPDTVDEALVLLDDAHQAGDGYPPEMVAALIGLLTTGTDPAALAERARYAAWLEDTARGGRDLTDGAKAGLRTAARHLRENLADRATGRPS